jgi:exonuclease SbcC
MLLPSINAEIGQIVSILSGGAISAGLDLDSKNKFQIKAKSRSGGSRYGLFSEGEAQRVNLAICFGASMAGRLRNGGSNFLLIDEGAAAIDVVGAERLAGVLEYIASQIGCVVVISHRDELKNTMPRLIEARKSRGLTRYAEVESTRVDEFPESV